MSGMTIMQVRAGRPQPPAGAGSPDQLVAGGDRDARSRRPSEPDDHAAEGGKAEPVHGRERDPADERIEEVVKHVVVQRLPAAGPSVVVE